jgi:hypothetical protein
VGDADGDEEADDDEDADGEDVADFDGDGLTDLVGDAGEVGSDVGTSAGRGVGLGDRELRGLALAGAPLLVAGMVLGAAAPL